MNSDEDARVTLHENPWALAAVAVVLGVAVDTALVVFTDYTPQFYSDPVGSMWGPLGMPVFVDSPGIMVIFGVVLLQVLRGRDLGGDADGV